MKSLIIRADSSAQIGAGHIMRDLVLAQRDFKEYRVIFAVCNLKGNINHKITELGYEIVILQSSSIEELATIAKEKKAYMIVIDHYGIKYDDEKRLKELTGAKIFVLDDIYQKHYCDILLNHNIYAKAFRYKNLVPKHSTIKCGEKYTLLRKEFIEVKKTKNRKKTGKKHIFISMGGSDSKGITIKLLDILKKIKNIEVSIFTTQVNPTLNRLKKRVKNYKFATLYIDSNSFAKELSKSDLAIISPSVIANEAYYMGIEILSIKVANNQKEMCRFLKYSKKKQTLNKYNKKEVLNLIKWSIK